MLSRLVVAQFLQSEKGFGNDFVFEHAAEQLSDKRRLTILNQEVNFYGHGTPALSYLREALLLSEVRQYNQFLPLSF